MGSLSLFPRLLFRNLTLPNGYECSWSQYSPQCFKQEARPTVRTRIRCSERYLRNEAASSRHRPKRSKTSQRYRMQSQDPGASGPKRTRRDDTSSCIELGWT